MTTYIPTSPSPLIKSESLLESKESFAIRWLIMPKILYFMLNLFVYGFHSLLFMLFIKQWKFAYYMYGYATLIVSMNFFGALIWSSLADRTGRYKLIIIGTAIAYTIVACSMLLFKAEEGEKLTMYKIVLVFVGFGFFNFFLSAAFPLVDAMILGMLSTYPNVTKDQFGNQRMFGAIGHFVATLCAMTLYRSKDDVLSVFIFQLVVSTIFILCVWFGVKDVQPLKGGHHHHYQPPNKTRNFASRGSPTASAPLHQVPVSQALAMAPTPAPPAAVEELSAEGQAGQKHPVRTLLLDPNFLFFMLFIACLGVVRSVSSSFQKLIAVDIAHGSNVMAALVDGGRMVSEIFVYLVSKRLKNAMGIYWILIFSQVMGILRILGYANVSIDASYAYWAAWGLELIKGFSSGLVSSSAIPIASRIAAPGCENSAQGLFSGNYSGLSMALGGLIGGGILHLYYYEGCSLAEQSVHAQSMFMWVAIGTSVVTFLMTIKYIFVDRVVGIPGFPRRQSV